MRNRIKTKLMAVAACALASGAAGCIGWVPAQREIALRSIHGQNLIVTNATTQPIGVMAIETLPAEAFQRVPPGQSMTIAFGAYSLIEAQGLNGTPQGWRADTDQKAHVTITDEPAEGHAGHYLEMQGREARLRIKLTTGVVWIYRLELEPSLLDAPTPSGYELKISGAPETDPIRLGKRP